MLESALPAPLATHSNGFVAINTGMPILSLMYLSIFFIYAPPPDTQARPEAGGMHRPGGFPRGSPQCQPGRLHDRHGPRPGPGG